MALYLLTNVGKEFSYSSLKKIFGLGSTNTAISFVSYFEDSYLLFTAPIDYSLKKQLVNPKKAYSIDNGLSGANSVSFSSDRGRMLENTVFLHLRRRHKDIFYFKGKNECDFLVKEKGKISSAIQVCYELHEDNKKREINGIIEAMSEFKLKESFIGLALADFLFSARKPLPVTLKSIKNKKLEKLILSMKIDARRSSRVMGLKEILEMLFPTQDKYRLITRIVLDVLKENRFMEDYKLKEYIENKGKEEGFPLSTYYKLMKEYLKPFGIVRYAEGRYYISKDFGNALRRMGEAWKAWVER